MTDLIERLRRRGPNGGLFCECGDEAADHIEKLEADNARLRGAVIEYERGFGPGDGDSAALQETSHDA